MLWLVDFDNRWRYFLWVVLDYQNWSILCINILLTIMGNVRNKQLEEHTAWVIHTHICNILKFKLIIANYKCIVYTVFSLLNPQSPRSYFHIWWLYIIYIYIYIYIYVCVCVCVCVYLSGFIFYPICINHPYGFNEQFSFI